jgi:hypothetical protein
MLVALPCAAQEVTVRVINAANGRPLENQPVHVTLMNGDRWADDDVHLRLKTDVKGEAHFTLPRPAPKHVDVGTGMSPNHWDCGLCWDRYAPRDVIQKGVVARMGDKPTKIATSLKSTPGEILFPRRPVSFFEWLYMVTIGA